MIPTAIQAKIREERQMTGRCGCALRNRTSLALSCPSFVCCLLKPCCTFHSKRRLSFQMRVVSIRGKYSNACQDNQTTKEGAGICQHKRQQRTSGCGQKRNMMPITSVLDLTPHTIVFLCVSSIHTTLERSLTSIATVRIAFPPKPYLQHKHQRRRRISVIRLW